MVALSDTHAGNRYALCNPDTWLHDDDRGDYHPTLTIGQRWLWNCYEQDILSVMELADGDPVEVIHLGDVIQGIRFLDGLSESRFADQIAVAAANGAPWWLWDNVQSVTVVSGTAVHEGGEGSAAELVATLWNAASIQHGLLSVDGVLIDVAHHGPAAGIREWTRGNVARLYLLDRMMTDDPPARVYLRAHRHEPVWVTQHRGDTTADLLVTPAYQLPSAYVRQVAQSPSAAVCGMISLVIQDGELAGVHRFTHRVDLRKRVTL